MITSIFQTLIYMNRGLENHLETILSTGNIFSALEMFEQLFLTVTGRIFFLITSNVCDYEVCIKNLAKDPAEEEGQKIHYCN